MRARLSVTTAMAQGCRWRGKHWVGWHVWACVAVQVAEYRWWSSFVACMCEDCTPSAAALPCFNDRTSLATHG